ncbi:PleD family two-component system response regulator [Geobacter sp. SVR]|uniref:response regulator n=1 Tax=Geobacter sp. SVR TaxID=2495594 RepID=UPI00143EF4C3|nr:response regulator [Geobacter sp. SVR]BCS54067.1 hypothetical protein GSVR_23750 [Geobacter sp. SVR]GCF87550.1 response regulator [Geobacter sp. SVR]
MRIAALDDCKSQLAFYSMMLKGHEVIAFSDPDAFLERVEELHPDFVVLDLVMPYMTGIEVVEKLKQQEGTKDIPVVLCSGMQGEEYSILAKKCKAAEFVCKEHIDRLKEIADQWSLKS